MIVQARMPRRSGLLVVAAMALGVSAGSASAQVGGAVGVGSSPGLGMAAPNVTGAGTGLSTPANIGRVSPGLGNPAALPSPAIAPPSFNAPASIGPTGPGTALPGVRDPRTGVPAGMAVPRPR